MNNGENPTQKILELAKIKKQRRDARISQGLTANRSFLEKFQEKPTRQNAIDLVCENCMGGHDNPGVTSLIRSCPSGPTSEYHYPLWGFRPYK